MTGDDFALLLDRYQRAQQRALDPIFHAEHWAVDSRTGERVEEASVVVDGKRIFWCGYEKVTT